MSQPFQFNFDLLNATSDLRPEHSEDFQRLIKTLTYGPRFQLHIAEFNHFQYRAIVIEKINQIMAPLGKTPVTLNLTAEQYPNIDALELALTVLSLEHAQPCIVHLCSDSAAGEALPDDHWFQQQWRAFNLRRESIAECTPGPLVLWLHRASIAQMAEQAPDQWSWRSGVYQFDVDLSVEAQAVLTFEQPELRRQRNLEQKTRRIAQLKTALENDAIPDSIRLSALDELADIYEGIGQLDHALDIRRTQILPLVEKTGDVNARAVTLGKIADVLQARGELDEAVRIRREEELPVYDKLGDVRSRAITLGQIADVLQARGELDEALRIRREEELPVYDKLGDVRSRAITLGQIADVLQARGELDEALRIRREEALPVYEKLGDIRSRAITLGQIADVLQARGELDEALRIRREEELPVYEKLGDVRSRAITLGQIADVLQARGELDEALRIRREEQLPVYDRLGSMRDQVMSRWHIAHILTKRAYPGDLDEAITLLQQAKADADRMQLKEAPAIANWLTQAQKLRSQRS